MAAISKKKTTKKDEAGKALLKPEELLWAEPANGKKIGKKLFADAKKSLAELVPCLSESNDDQATQAFFALESMVMLALDPECPLQKRQELVDGLCQHLPTARDAYSRSQLIRYLGMLGQDCVEALRPWLDKKEYFEVTLLALRHIGSFSALDLIREKMAAAKGADYVALVVAASDWEDSESFDQDKLSKVLAKASDDDLPSLWQACAKCDLTFIVDDLLTACNAKKKTIAGAARASLSLLISNIYDWETAVTLGQQFYQTCPCPTSLQSWCDACGQELSIECYDALTEAIKQDDPGLRNMALDLLSVILDNGVETEVFIEFANSLSAPSVKASVVRMLGKHGKTIARPFIMACLWDKELEVREAALQAAEAMQGKLASGIAAASAVYR